MFEDQKKYLTLAHIFSDIICLAVVYAFFIPLFLSVSGQGSSLYLSILLQRIPSDAGYLPADPFLALTPFPVLLPPLFMMSIRRLFPLHRPGLSSICIHAAIQAAVFTVLIWLEFRLLDISFPARTSVIHLTGAATWVILAGKEMYYFILLNQKKGHMTSGIIHILIAGTGAGARRLNRHIRNAPGCGFRVAGFMSITTAAPPSAVATAPADILGTWENLIDILHHHYVDCVVCPEGGLDPQQMDFILKHCAIMGINFATDAPLPPWIYKNSRQISQESMGHLNVSLVRFVYLSPQATFFKRMVDVTGAAILIFLCLPLWITIAIAIKTTSRGPVFFRQERMGLHGRRFTLYKFRSMVMDAEKMQAGLLHLNEMDGPAFKIKRDPRQTLTGRVLRKTSLDELPQLFNVLKGDISFVGPRPALEKEVRHYRPMERKRLSVPQGITCIWQVSGRNNIKFDEWMKLDLMYADTRSTAQDFRILLKTIPAVLLKNGAY